MRTAHVNRDDIRQEIREIVEGYFRTDRPLFLQEFRTESLFTGVDQLMQELLRVSQVRSRRSRYLEVLSALDHEWREVEVKALPLARKMTGEPELQDSQEAIAKTLESLCPSAAACYRQALADLSGPERLSWRGTASELRESLRELLDKLAPDHDVVNSPGFKYENGLKAPTMKQKVRFILKSRRWPEGQRKQMEVAVDVVEEKVGSFVRSVYSGSSSFVHAQGAKKEVQSILRFVETALGELLELENR